MSTDTTSPVRETREFRIHCRRKIVDGCEIFDEVTSTGHGIRSIAAAEAAFREAGWTLHTDGTASCPVCLDAWENGIEPPTDHADPDEIHGLDEPEVEYVPNEAPEDDR